MMDTTITLGNLLTIAGFFMAFGISWAKMDKRIALIEQAVENMKEWMRSSDEEDEAVSVALEQVKEAVIMLRRDRR